jgi:transglutaminase-like putative cysteine protease
MNLSPLYQKIPAEARESLMPVVIHANVPGEPFRGGATYQTLVGDAQGSTPIRGGIQSSPPGYRTPLHSHPYMETITVLDGEGEAWIEDRDELIPLKPGVTLVITPSRYCETDRLSEVAWRLFEKSPPGWGRIQAICDFVHRHIAFGYEHARPTMTSWEVFNEGKGVCRDFAHLAISFCRCMNIPARYCTGYLGDIGVPPPYGPMDFAGWFEAYLGGRWYTFDPRNNMPRIGRVLIAQGRDATDVPITHTFGPSTLVSFKVWTDEVN